MIKLAEIIKATDEKIIERLKHYDMGYDERAQEVYYRELNRRYIKRAADRVIVAAIITGLVTILLQIIG